MKELRDYQVELSKKGAAVLSELKIVYYCMQVRTGKTATALETAKIHGSKNVLFLTKKKAISSIENDYLDFGYEKSFKLTVINNESLHTITDNDFDLVVMDEAHRLGAFPKPTLIAKNFKERFSKLPIIFLSGTPHPESYSQIFHQFWVSENTPFSKYKNFYQWFNGSYFVKTEFDLGYGLVSNYTNNKDVIYKQYAIMLRKIPKSSDKYEEIKRGIEDLRRQDIERMEMSNLLLELQIDRYMIPFTQIEAGFKTEVVEHVLYCDMQPVTDKLIRTLRKDKVIQGSEEVILADTAVKLMSKVHQLCSGTVKFESGNSKVIDHSKAIFISNYFKGKKLAIFYKFKEELDMLKNVFKEDLTTDLDSFEIGSQNIALQIISGREGISLSKADYLIFLNIDFSAISYFQAKDRLTTMDRKTNDVYWIFSRNGIEEKIYNTVLGKKDYTLSAFTKDFSINHGQQVPS